MPRTSGTYRILRVGRKDVRAFAPAPLPPASPPLVLDSRLNALHAEALGAVGKLGTARTLVSSAPRSLCGFVRKEAILSSEMEGTQATLQDVVMFEAIRRTERPDDVRDACNHVDALTYAREEIARPKGLP